MSEKKIYVTNYIKRQTLYLAKNSDTAFVLFLPDFDVN